MKEIITGRQGVNVMVLFILGSAVVLGSASEAGQDTWMAIILAALSSVPAVFIYSKLTVLMPDKDLFDLAEFAFGKILGKVLNILYVWYAFHLGALVIRNFGEFIQIVSMPETPLFVIALMMGVFCIWMVRTGLEVLSRWATFICPIVVLSVILVTLLAIPIMDINNLKPVLYNGFQPVIKSSFMAFSFPFAETVIFTTVLSALKVKQEALSVYLKSLAICGGILFAIAARNILVLGTAYASGLYFPSYAAASLINISDFLERIEITVAVNFLLAGIIKISICLYAACKGISKLFGLHDYKPLAPPVGLLMIDLSILVYQNAMEMVDWAFKIYPYYALPFQVLFPLLILIVAWIKTRQKPFAASNTKTPS